MFVHSVSVLKDFDTFDIIQGDTLIHCLPPVNRQLKLNKELSKVTVEAEGQIDFFTVNNLNPLFSSAIFFDLLPQSAYLHTSDTNGFLFYSALTSATAITTVFLYKKKATTKKKKKQC